MQFWVQGRQREMNQRRHHLSAICPDKIVSPIRNEPNRVKLTGRNGAQCQYRYRVACGLTCGEYEVVEPFVGTLPDSGPGLCGRPSGSRCGTHSQSDLSLWQELRASVRNQSDLLSQSLSSRMCAPQTGTFRTQHGPAQNGKLLNCKLYDEIK